MPSYFTKSIQVGNSGVFAECWAVIAGTFQVQKNSTTTYTFAVVGYLTKDVYLAGGEPVPSASLPYQIQTSDFSNLAGVYTALAAKANADSEDPLNGATLVVVA